MCFDDVSPTRRGRRKFSHRSQRNFRPFTLTAREQNSSDPRPLAVGRGAVPVASGRQILEAVAEQPPRLVARVLEADGRLLEVPRVAALQKLEAAGAPLVFLGRARERE